MRTPSLALVLTIAMDAATPALAQDGPPRERPSIANEARPRPPECADSRYTLCWDATGLTPRGLLPPPSRAAAVGRLTRLTRLAGMFMGRVPAGRLGPLQLRLKLDVR